MWATQCIVCIENTIKPSVGCLIVFTRKYNNKVDQNTTVKYEVFFWRKFMPTNYCNVNDIIKKSVSVYIEWFDGNKANGYRLAAVI